MENSPRVSPDSLSSVGAFLALGTFFSGLYLTGMAATAAQDSVHGILALCLFPITIAAAWLVTKLDYRVRLAFDRWRHPR